MQQFLVSLTVTEFCVWISLLFLDITGYLIHYLLLNKLTTVPSKRFVKILIALLQKQLHFKIKYLKPHSFDFKNSFRSSTSNCAVKAVKHISL